MKIKIKLLYTLFFFFVVFQISLAQSPNEQAARSELAKRGYDADRFNQEMLKKGVDPAKIDPKNPSDVARAKKAAEEVAAMLDKEKKATSTPSTDGTNIQEPQSKTDNVRSADAPSKIANQTKDIQKAVKDGATIEEAVSEKLQEVANEKVPQATTYGQ